MTHPRRADFCAARLAGVHPQIRAWVPPEQVEAAIQAEIDHALERVERSDLADRFARAVPVPGVTAEHYRGAVISVGSGHLLLGLRFAGLDPERPFAEVIATCGELDVNEALQAIVEHWAVFRLRTVRVHDAGPDSIRPWTHGRTWRFDHRIVAGEVATIQARSTPPGKLVLEPVTDSSIYARYRAAYDRFNATRPDNPLYITSSETFAALIEHGYTFSAHCDGSWAGLIAACPDPFFGRPAFLVHEELLVEAFRGQGLGPVLQRALIDRLPAHSLVWGSIDASNSASLATAIRVGRQDVGGQVFVEV